jgi:hypothetical protein
LWIVGNSNGVLADGVYLMHWKSSCCKNRDIFLYKNGRTKVLANIDDQTILKRVEKFLIKNGCDEQQRIKCLKAVSDNLNKRDSAL